MERHTRISKVRASLLNKLKATITGKCNSSEFNEAHELQHMNSVALYRSLHRLETPIFVANK